MVIRFNKATRFVCVCALLLVTALISIGTKSISVSAPYMLQGQPLPVVVYRGVGGEAATALSLRELRDDLAWLGEKGYSALSEPELVAALRRESPLPGAPVLLLFDDAAPDFTRLIKPVLDECGVSWFPMGKSGLLTQELRAAGHPVTRLERSAGFTLEEQMKLRA